MRKEINHLLKDNEKLRLDKHELQNRLQEANDIIEAVKKGNVDAVFNGNNNTAEILIPKTADPAYRKFIENMSEGVVTLHTNGIIVYSNSSFAKMVNLSLEKVIGERFRNLISVKYVENFERIFNNYAGSNSKMDLSILNPEGITSYYTVSLNPLQFEDFVALNLVLTDVTDQKKAEKELMIVNNDLVKAIEARILSENDVVILNNKLNENIEILKHANIELATFAHIASHDLQEPLRKIIRYSDLLTSDYFSMIDQQGQGYINSIQGASIRMRNLINDILEFSELSQKDILFKPANLQSIVNEILSDLEIIVKETKAIITIEKELPVIDVNSNQMRQLFQNILSNSLKFIEAGTIPEINITYETIKKKEMDKTGQNMIEREFCVLRIKDNGIGFKEEYANKIFTIFQKLNNNSLYPGTGIGLAICKRIAENHHGFITAESKLNKGATFIITLPVCQVIGENYVLQDDYCSNA